MAVGRDVESGGEVVFRESKPGETETCSVGR